MSKTLKKFFKEGNIKGGYIRYIKRCLNLINDKWNINLFSIKIGMKKYEKPRNMISYCHSGEYG